VESRGMTGPRHVGRPRRPTANVESVEMRSAPSEDAAMAQVAKEVEEQTKESQ